MTYIWEHEHWTNFTWDQEAIEEKLREIRKTQGRIEGTLGMYGFDRQRDAYLDTLVGEIQSSSEIEGELYTKDEVRSSVARKLGFERGGLLQPDRNVDGVVAMALDAARNPGEPLTRERLFDWHRHLFPEGRSGTNRIITGQWRTDAEGPMRVISGPMGRETVHFTAPPASAIEGEMDAFLAWFEARDYALDPIVKSALAHFRFVTIHPFDDGNGRIARAIADLQLARADGGGDRYYSMSVQIRKSRKTYYSLLEEAQKGTGDLTRWVTWYVGCLSDALAGTEEALEGVRDRARFWDRANAIELNARQRKMLTLMLDGFKGNMTSSKWATLAKCSQDTAGRDIAALVNAGLLEKSSAGGRSTSYGAILKP